jgi:hypothetical protein
LDDQSNAGIVTKKKPRAARLVGWFASSFDWILKRGWIEVEAEVQECITPAANSLIDSAYYDGSELLAGENLVTFIYSVEGKTYTGILSSRDEVQKGDKFPIKCNPRNPEENNSIDSQSNWTVEYTAVLAVFLIALFVGFFVLNFLLHL